MKKCIYLVLFMCAGSNPQAHNADNRDGSACINDAIANELRNVQSNHITIKLNDDLIELRERKGKTEKTAP